MLFQDDRLPRARDWAVAAALAAAGLVVLLATAACRDAVPGEWLGVGVAAAGGLMLAGIRGLILFVVGRYAGVHVPTWVGLLILLALLAVLPAAMLLGGE